MIDTANVYSAGASEEIVGEALGDKRDSVLIATKARMRIGASGANEGGASRWHIIRECEKSLKRLRTDRIDLYFMHEWDGHTPLEETLEALDTLVRSGKVRYVGCSNYSGVAHHEGARRLRPPRLPALRLAADLLFAAGPRGGIRAGARRGRPGRRHHGVEPDRRRPAVGKIPPRPEAGGGAPPDGLGRAARLRRGASSTTSSTSWWRSPMHAASRRRRWRLPG